MATKLTPGLFPQLCRIFPPRWKNVILCFMPGGVSHMDTFDPKPKLAELDASFRRRAQNLAEVPLSFKRYGQSGMPVSELLPTSPPASTIWPSSVPWSPGSLSIPGATSCSTPAERRGPSQPGILDHLRSGQREQEPARICAAAHRVYPPGGLENFSNGFLPATHQALPVKAEGNAIDNLVAS